jgi:phosphoglycerate dehydrogenase-like enzyme
VRQSGETEEPTVFVEGVGDEEARARIRAVPGARVEFFGDHDELDRRIPEADAVAGRVSAHALARASRLRWVQSWMAGPDEALSPEMIASDVALTSCKGNGAIPLAEHAMWLMLTLNRDAVRWVRAQEAQRWERHTHGELNGRTVGIIGLGHSGVDLAQKAKAFHMNVLGLRRADRPTEHVDELLPLSRLRELLARSDFVVVTAPLTPETRGMLGEEEFRAMKPTAFFIVFSRGGIADDAAPLRALDEGWIAGAGLDNFSEEPLAADSPFWTARNTICTPHNGATTEATLRRGADIFIDNLGRFARGEELVNIVDKAAGY